MNFADKNYQVPMAGKVSFFPLVIKHQATQFSCRFINDQKMKQQYWKQCKITIYYSW